MPQSRAEENIFVSKNIKFLPNNGAILTVAQLIKNVILSTTEVELGTLYIVAKNMRTYILFVVMDTQKIKY